MENNRFEDSFRNAFDGAEILPSAAVWKNIELDLAKESGGKLKRNLLMFQLLAAASVAFAIGITALYYLDQPVTQNGFSKETVSKQDIAPTPHITTESPDQKIKSEGSITKMNKEKSTHQKEKRNDTGINTTAIQSTQGQPVELSVEYKIKRTDWSAYVTTKKPMLILPQAEGPVEPDAGMVLLARLKDEEKKYQDEEKKSFTDEKTWASVGFGAGSYKPNVQSSSVRMESAGDVASSSSSESVAGASYSVGINVATKISKRFIVQGGVSYLTQNADFTSTSLNHGGASLNEFMKVSEFSDFNSASPYTVTSSLKFVSIPVQAGYMIVDRDFGIQVNGGIATDVFVRSTLSPENDTYQKVTQGAGKDSPYRTVNFSGLLGTEFSYRIANHYRISLNPGLRYSLNSIYKEEVAAEILPVTFDVSLRFRYIFK